MSRDMSHGEMVALFALFALTQGADIRFISYVTVSGGAKFLHAFNGLARLREVAGGSGQVCSR